MTPNVLLAGAALVLIGTVPSLAQQQSGRLTREDVERFADSAFSRYVNAPAPSLAVVVVQGDSVLLAKGYGTERDSIPVSTERTVFHIASLSKLFVVTALMQQVELGRVRLDAPVATFLPDLDVLADVTVRHLLTHTSGIDAPFLGDVVGDTSRLPSLSEYFAAHRPRFGRPPGVEIRYSNHGMALAARIVEKASGESFDAYIERHIFAKLGMHGSAIRQPLPPHLRPRVATTGAGLVPNFLLVYPAGAVMSTPADMGRFLRSLLGSGESQMLSAASRSEMAKQHWTAHRDIPGVALGFFETDMGGVRALFHTGARVHFSLLYLLPEHRVGMFIVHSMRQGGPFQSLRTDVARAFAGRYFADAAMTPVADRAAPDVKTVSGTYRPLVFSRTTMERAAWLFADTRVVANADRSLDVRLPASRPLRLLPRGRVFRAESGEQAGLAVAFDSTGVGRMFLSGATQDPITFHRLRWFERGLLHLVLLAIAYLVMTSYVFGRLSAAAWRTLKKKPRPDYQPSERRANWSLLVSSTLLALTPALTVAMLSANSNGPRRAVAVGATLFFAGALFGVVSVPLTLVAWRETQWGRGRRAYFALCAACSVLLFTLVWYYHLGPFWI